MAHETVPADIAAAIQAYAMAVRSDEAARSVQDTPDGILRASWARCDKALADLNAAILHHLRAYDEMKAALEAQTSGGA